LRANRSRRVARRTSRGARHARLPSITTRRSASSLSFPSSPILSGAEVTWVIANFRRRRSPRIFASLGWSWTPPAICSPRCGHLGRRPSFVDAWLRLPRRWRARRQRCCGPSRRGLRRSSAAYRRPARPPRGEGLARRRVKDAGIKERRERHRRHVTAGGVSVSLSDQREVLGELGQLV
jgi:hypothetical protein